MDCQHLSPPPGHRVLHSLLDQETLAAVRTVALEAAWRRGWVSQRDSQATRLSGVRLAYEDPSYVSFQADVLASRTVNALRQHPRLTAAVTAAAGCPVTPLNADVCRITFPGEPSSTLPHQDAHYLNRTDFWTAWIPLTSCPAEAGAIAVALGSRSLGLLPHDGEHGISGTSGLQWSCTPLSPGDVLLFHALTIHRALPNRLSGSVRLSIDLRFAVE